MLNTETNSESTKEHDLLAARGKNKSMGPAKERSSRLKKIKGAGRSVKVLQSQLKALLQLQKNKIHLFKPKIHMEHSRGAFTLKTVSQRRELIAALRLRYDVFSREFKGATAPVGVDVDSFDVMFDHLIIKENKHNKVIGTYRLSSSAFNERFYSAEEFDLSQLMALPGTKIEMGRACVHKDYRKGSTMALLWRGIAEYMLAAEGQYLFGCGSVKTEDPRESAMMYKYFEQKGHLDKSTQVIPTEKYTMPGLEAAIAELSGQNDGLLTDSQIEVVEKTLPALFKAYLKAGATVCGKPAYDKEFHCIDFLVLLNKDQINGTHGKKYGLD